MVSSAGNSRVGATLDSAMPPGQLSSKRMSGRSHIQINEYAADVDNLLDGQNFPFDQTTAELEHE